MPDIPNSFGEINFEKLESLQRLYGLINVMPPGKFDGCIFFVIACKKLKIAQIV